MKDNVKPAHQNTLPPADNKFHIGNGSDGKHYWLTPPVLLATTRLRPHAPGIVAFCAWSVFWLLLAYTILGGQS